MIFSKTYKIILVAAILPLFIVSCDMFQGMDVENSNSPNLEQVYSDPQEYPSLISGAYKTWWNESIGMNPNLALGVTAEIITSGYGSWGMGDFYKVPRQPVVNENADDMVLDPVYGAWYSYYSALPTVNNIIREIEQNGKKVIVGDQDQTQGVLAHAYFLQGMLVGHLGLIYDKAFLITEETNINEFDYEFTSREELIDFSLNRMDKAIEITNTASFTDPIEVMPNVQFNNNSLGRFINSTAARILVASARNTQETESLDWARVEQYARNGIAEDFKVHGENGWVGLAISRDELNPVHIAAWDWIRVNQRIVHMLAPNDPGAEYPWPEGEATLPEVTNPMDKRLEKDFTYAGQHGAWNPQSKGYHILSNYKYSRYYDEFGVDGVGDLSFFLKAENDLLLAEAIARTAGPNNEAAQLVNNTRVNRGEMQALDGTESKQEMLDAIMHERYIELMFTYHALGYFDRRRTDDLLEGSAKQFPVPAKELMLHGFEIYTFGG